MRSTLKLLLVINLIIFNAYAFKCEPLTASQKVGAVVGNLKQQIKIVDGLLKGKKSASYTPQVIFGLEFNIDKTDQKIEQIKRIINETKGITIENITLYNCVSGLGFNIYAQELSRYSTELLNKKIALLEKYRSLGDSITATGVTENTLPSLKYENDKDSSEALKAKVSLEDKLIKTQSQANTIKSPKKREVLEYENELTKIKISLLNIKIETNKNLEKKIAYFETKTKKLKSLSGQLDTNDNKKLTESFKEVEKIWLDLSSEKYFEIIKANSVEDLPEIPTPLDQKKFKSDISNVLKLRSELVDLRKDIVRNYTEKKNQELKLLNHLVASSNSIRESYFKKLGHTYFFKSFFRLDSYVLLKSEIVSAPYRIISFFYSKYLYLREQLTLGKEGYVNLFSLGGYLFLLLFAFYVLKYLFSKVNENIDKLFDYFFRKRRRSFLLRKLFTLWSKLKVSSISILWLVTLFIVQRSAVLVEVNLLIKVANVFLGARIIKSLVTLFLGNISRLDTGNFREFKVKANNTSNKFKNIFSFYFYTMILIEATVGQVYLYSIINYCVLVYSVYLLLHESSMWESELRKYSEKMFSGVIVERYFKVLEYSPKRLVAFFIFSFILVFLVFDFFISLTENFEISKKISANLFKKQIEKIEAEEGADGKIPAAYKEQFSLKSLSSDDEYVENSQGLEDKIDKEIQEWVKDCHDEHSVVIYGDKGIGKTTFLKKLVTNIELDENLEAKYVKMPSKTTSKQEMYQFIHSIFSDEPFDGNFDIHQYDQRLNKKTIVVIDEAQNVFLSKTGGFDAYYAFINFLNLNTKNIFWVMSFNKYSWLYLNRAFGRTQFFRNVFELSGWSDSKIKELIMRRHSKTDYLLSYDLLINATRSQDEIDKYASIESKFFKLLWELSRGNPRTALYLWISALSRKSKNTFNVNVPKNIELNGIERMPDELLFVIAHVIKHENLSSAEIETTTNLQKGLVRNAIKLGLEKKFFFKDERSRYMVDISTQYGLIRFLKLKNFIYGN